MKMIHIVLLGEGRIFPSAFQRGGIPTSLLLANAYSQYFFPGVALLLALCIALILQIWWMVHLAQLDALDAQNGLRYDQGNASDGGIKVGTFVVVHYYHYYTAKDLWKKSPMLTLW